MQIKKRQVACVSMLLIAGSLAGCCSKRCAVRHTGYFDRGVNSESVGSIERRTNGLGLKPGANADDGSGLVFLEPYQPGKIPVVFIHGLLSSPDTWSNLLSELRCRPDILAQYQFWAFAYPTGVSFLRSAERLRKELFESVYELDPNGADPALHRMVLVGHSMGGLVAKLQVTDSGPWLWSSISNCPIDSICTDDATRDRLRSALYFHPHAFVERVIFIAVPHRGSSIAARLVGRIGSSLMEVPEQDEWRYRQLMRDNPNAFASFVRRGLPTSVDMLQPGNPLLTAVEVLPVSDRVHLHSIIGTGMPMITSGPADGVVPVSSAWHIGVESELRVPTTHRWIHREPDTAAEVARILRMHAAISKGSLSFLGQR